VGLIAGLAGLGGLGWLGLRVRPAPFPAFPGPTGELETIPLPADLPPPVERFFHATIGQRLPLIHSAVISARGHLRLGGLTLPMRIRLIHEAGRAYRHYIEATWLSIPVLRVNERYLNGHARLELPTGVVDHEPKVDRAANLAFWAESFSLPSVLVTDPRVRWEAVDDTTARCLVPFGDQQDVITVRFDPQTGLVQSTQALRYRSATDAEPIPWRVDNLGWQTFHDLRLASPIAITWLDQGRPWFIMELDEVVYNADVSEYIRARGP
jgi:hypothetical protein